MPDENVADQPRRHGFSFNLIGFVASGFTPDEKRNVGDGLASGVNPNVGYETRRYVLRSFGFVAAGFMPDAPDETVADQPRRYELKSKRRGLTPTLRISVPLDS
jgi:hypothetical protein